MATAKKIALAPLKASEQEAIIQERLAVPERHLKYLMSKLHAIAKCKATDERERAICSFELELETFMLNIVRLEAVARKTTTQEVDDYNDRLDKMKDERAQTEELIDALKEELIHVRQDRQNKLVYDELAIEIQKYDTREELENSLTSLRESIAELETESQTFTQVMKASEQKFEGIASQLDALRAEVGYEVGEHERKAVERGGGEDDGAAGNDEEGGEAGAEGSRRGGGGPGDGGAEREDERESKRATSLNPSAPSFRPLRSAMETAASSRASTPGKGKRNRSLRQLSVTREGEEEEEGGSRRRKSSRKALEEGEMSDAPEDEEEEEGAA